MTQPLISVIIPAHNYARYLPAAIDSVLAQDYTNIELIVIDDGSTDDTPEVLTTLAGRIRSLRQPNGGIASARNTGYRLAHGDFIAFLDADDLFTPGRLAVQMAAFHLEPSLDCVQGFMEQFISPELPATFVRGIRGKVEGVRAAPIASTTLIRRAAYDRVGPWDETLNIGVDMDWYARMQDAGLNYRLLQRVLLRRRIHRNNTNLRFAHEQSERLTVLKEILDRRRKSQVSTSSKQGDTPA